MQMKNSQYWKLRFKQLEEAQNNMANIAFSEIETQYRTAQKEIEAQIDRWYQRLAVNNGVSKSEARKILSANELRTSSERIPVGCERLHKIWQRKCS